jgi:adenylate kinase
MRIAVTGTPGTGKTTATGRLTSELPVFHLNEVVREEGLSDGEDPDRGSLVADLEALRSWAAGREGVFESHLAHHLDADRVVVLRCRPETVERRLRERGEPAETAVENAEAEALDVILAEAVDRHGRDRVYEIDTTDRSPAEVADAVDAVRRGEREPAAGEVDFSGYLTT